ncbi:MAG: hypothetical protein KIS94_01220 [Chitinophagales bacterium]|nr:hypothetical protein [Chitinophagales bacterium]
MNPKKILVLYYTQSGQLGEVVTRFSKPFAAAGVSVETISIKPINDYAFPWTSERFFDTMPETVLGITTALQPVNLQEQKYDLVVFAYQPWYLSLSIPANSALHEPAVKEILKNTPVVTLIAARNMWLHAQEQAKQKLREAGAKLVGNIALVDRHHNLISVVTILYWMLTGKKDKYLGVFPKPGVSDEDIRNSENFGKIVCRYLQEGNWSGMQHELVTNGAVDVKEDLMFVEERAPRLFSIWANFIFKRKNRKGWLVVFKYYLLFALFIVAPIVLLLNFLLFRWFLIGNIKRRMAHYAGVE